MYSRLLDMTLKLQMQNIGTEVSRTVRFLSKNDLDKALSRGNEAIKMLSVVSNDPKNLGREREFMYMIEELREYMNGCPNIDVDPNRMLTQYTIFDDL